MSGLLSTLYGRLHDQDKLDLQVYWTKLRYTGCSIDELTLVNAAAQIKGDIVDRVISLLPNEYKDIPKLFSKLVVETTLYDDGFLLTPLEALEALNTLSRSVEDYKLLATYISSVSIKERIKKVLREDSDELLLHDAVARKIITSLYPVPNYNETKLPLRFNSTSFHVTSHSLMNSLFLDTIYGVYTPIFYSLLERSYNRKLIYESIRNSYYLYLKGLGVLPFEGNTGKLDVPVTLKECRIAIPLLKYEVTVNHYEPILYTRLDSSIKATLPKVARTDVNNMQFIAYADTYSKVVRISNIRRRLILQDARYVISEAIKSAFVRIYEELLNGG